MFKILQHKNTKNFLGGGERAKFIFRYDLTIRRTSFFYPDVIDRFSVFGYNMSFVRA